jgi:predicted RNA-binding protein with EMAP domain
MPQLKLKRSTSEQAPGAIKQTVHGVNVTDAEVFSSSLLPIRKRLCVHVILGGSAKSVTTNNL